MNLTTPAALFWLGLAIPIIGLYVLKIRLRRVPVPTTLFWRQIFQDKKPRSIWRYLRHLLSLLLQLLLLALLALGLAAPFYESRIHDARRLVLVLDNSASMNAIDVLPSRLARAKEMAERLISGVRFGDEMAIVTAGNEARVVCGLTGHQRTLHHTLETVLPTDGPTRMEEAVALARRLLAGLQYTHKVVVLSDGCFPGAKNLAAAEDVQLVAVGSRAGNVGITQFQVRRSLRDPTGFAVLVEVLNASDEPVDCRFTLDLNDEPVDAVPLSLAANSRWIHVFEATAASGGRLVGRIDHDDALAADNQAVALLPRRDVRRVFLVTKPNWFLQKVFEACPLVDMTVTAELPASVPPGAMLVMHRIVPVSLPPGPVFVIDPSGSCDLWQLGEKLPNPVVTRQDRDSPVMAFVSLENLSLPDARKLTPIGGVPVQRLASAISEDPIFCAYERPQGRVLVLSVNLDRSELPLRTAFPILASNALNWLAGHHDDFYEAMATGGTMELPVPEDRAQKSSLWAPDGRNSPLSVYGSRAVLGPLDRCGVWTIAPDAPGTSDRPPFREIACNLANAQESDLRSPEGLPTDLEKSAIGLSDRPIWFYLLAAAWLVAALEWYLYQRRWVG